MNIYEPRQRVIGHRGGIRCRAVEVGHTSSVCAAAACFAAGAVGRTRMQSMSPPVDGSRVLETNRVMRLPIQPSVKLPYSAAIVLAFVLLAIMPLSFASK